MKLKQTQTQTQIQEQPETSEADKLKLRTQAICEDLAQLVLDTEAIGLQKGAARSMLRALGELQIAARRIH